MFKPGDIVEYVGDCLPFKSLYGLHGVVEALNPFDVRVRYPGVYLYPDSDDVYFFSAQNLKLVEERGMETILDEAKSLVYGDRNNDYGHPKEDMDRTAMMWSAILGTEVTAEKVALCMCAVKISRQCNKRKRDNLVDLAGYAEVANRIVEFEEAMEAEL